MRVDLPTPAELQTLPRFVRARGQLRALRAVAIALTVLALAAAGYSRSRWLPGDAAIAAMLLPLLHGGAAGLLALLPAMLSAGWIAWWRRQALQPAAPRAPLTPSPPDAPRWRRLLRSARIAVHTTAQALRARLPWDLLGTLMLTVPVLLAPWLLKQSWAPLLGEIPAAPTLGRLGLLAGGGTLLLAFALLVLERWLSAAGEAEWPEARVLSRLTRAALATLLLVATSLFGARGDARWPLWLAHALVLLPGAIALEVLLRLVLSLFTRRPPHQEPELLGDSFIARQLQWPPRPLYNLQQELQGSFGIDLRQSWAFAYMRSALLPVLGAVLLIGWLATGLRQIPMDGRAVHERFGAPVSVLGPGLHVVLPWPLSRLRPVEAGVIHAVSASTAVDDSDDGPDTSTAEGEAPVSANRLWDARHTNEKSQVIASRSNERQSFHVVNMDVRFIYRIGLSDSAALAATYHSNNLPQLIRSSAARVLVQHFASHTLEELIGAEREALSRDIGARVQQELDRLDSGVEILSTLVEAIHPPSAAANAYHSVQAAQIKSRSDIARERGRRAEEINEAQLQASLATDKAEAAARETRAKAQVQQTRFGAEQQAWRSAGQAFVFEQYLSQLSAGLKDGKLLLLDHRLGSAGNAPTLDLRPYTAPRSSDAAPP